MKEIPLTQGKVALVSNEDYEYLNQWRWYAQKTRKKYRALSGGGSHGRRYALLLMHRVIAERLGILAPQIDHIDRNPLNNQRENLRGATHGQNVCNQGPSKANTSGVKGVSYEKRTNRWRVRVGHEGKTYHFGSYADKEDAKRVASIQRKKLHGGFACDD